MVMIRSFCLAAILPMTVMAQTVSAAALLPASDDLKPAACSSLQLSPNDKGAATVALARELGNPGTERAKLRENSPDLHADRIQAPLLLAYGATDERVPLIHGTRMRSALDAAGKPYEWVVYADQKHTLFDPANREDFDRRVEAFLAKNLAVRTPVTTSSAEVPRSTLVQ